MGKAGFSTEKATHPIVHELTAKLPKTRYYVGRDARLFHIFDKLLSGRLRDWLMMCSIGLSDKNEALSMVTNGEE
jgi:hypothetical protein